MGGLRFGAIGSSAVHLCVDLQRLFAAEGPWPMPWMEPILPRVHRLAARHAERTVFTRFVPPRTPQDRPGRWRAYFEHWRGATLSQLDPALVDLVPDLAALVPPARVVDKPAYSAFTAPALAPLLAAGSVDTLIVTGGETDVCVLATVLGAIDRGYRVILARDGICSSADAQHDRLIAFYEERFSHQLEVAEVEEVLEAWDAG